MSEPYIGEIRIVAFNFAPRGWALCNGQLLAINQNQALFSILGTTYGGNGVQTFALPNLQSRTAIHWGTGPGLPTVNLGQAAGEENHTLTIAEMPAHLHLLNASNQIESQASSSGGYLANHVSPSNITSYAPANSANTAMIANEVSSTGGSQGHNNMQPYLVMNFVIALVGIFPPRN